MKTTDSTPPLARRLSLPLITLYGIGTILGAGIYVLAGKVAGESGIYTHYAFFMAAAVVSFSAHAYAKLSREFPVSAGEVAYIQNILHSKSLATTVGWAIVFTGVVSSATIAKGFAAYIEPYTSLPPQAVIFLLVTFLTALAISGVAQAVGFAAVFTVVEIIGIGIIIWFAAPKIPSFIQNNPEVLSVPPLEFFPAITFGAFLAFYAFIGFEDMVNMAEEVKRPEKNLPRAIYLSLIITSLLYALTALSFMALLPMNVFIGSDAPFAEVARNQHNLSLGLITFISIAAISNGALIQIIMGSRVLYGMAFRKLAPHFLSHVWGRTKTPVLSTLLVGFIVLLFALSLPVISLAKITSTIVLIIFSLVNISLFVWEWRKLFNEASYSDKSATKNKNIMQKIRDLLIPATGFTLCITFAFFQLTNLGNT
ncbi:MAG: amino acid permease [Cellvibrionaceae bacterium]